MLRRPMQDQSRVERTVDKARRRALPASTGDRAITAMIHGLACDGCEDIIDPGDVTAYGVLVRGVIALRFHGPCYLAWATFRDM